MDNIDFKELSSLELLELYKRINVFIDYLDKEIKDNLDGDDINA